MLVSLQIVIVYIDTRTFLSWAKNQFNSCPFSCILELTRYFNLKLDKENYVKQKADLLVKYKK
jgi:hypothetical protein